LEQDISRSHERDAGLEDAPPQNLRKNPDRSGFAVRHEIE